MYGKYFFSFIQQTAIAKSGWFFLAKYHLHLKGNHSSRFQLIKVSHLGGDREQTKL